MPMLKTREEIAALRAAREARTPGATEAQIAWNRAQYDVDPVTGLGTLKPAVRVIRNGQRLAVRPAINGFGYEARKEG